MRTLARRPAAAAAAGVVLLAGLVSIFVVDSARHTGHTAPPGKPSFVGNYETGNLRQWFQINAVPGSITLVRRPVHQGHWAARFTVRPGDTPLPDGRQRAEVAASTAQTRGTPGSAVWYGWATYFPRNYNPVPDMFNIFAQWHATKGLACPGAGPNIALLTYAVSRHPVISFVVRGGRSLHTPDGCQGQYRRMFATVPIRFDRWYDFVLHVKWSSNPRVGYYKLWIDGTPVVPFGHIATLYVHNTAFAKQGIYRATSNTIVSTVYEDAFAVGSSYAQVAPPPVRR
jgi:Polysaccharide lyase